MRKSLEKKGKKLIVIANFAILYKDFSYQKNKRTKEEMIMNKLKKALVMVLALAMVLTCAW